MKNKSLYDKLAQMFGDVIGGHHTTSGVMMWVAKYLTEFPHIQTQLRSVLYKTLSTAKEENRTFKFEEIRRAKLPYFDAVIEEMLRINAVTVTHEAMCDTVILGCPIAKGTQVFFMFNGPGFLSPSIPIDESKRSETSRSAKLNGTWDETQDLTISNPERWLVHKNNGEGLGENDVECDGAAGPQLVFGLGPRACWGRRLALMEIRILIAMLVWNFELLETPPAISSHAGLEGIARVPQQCHIRLSKIEYHGIILTKPSVAFLCTSSIFT
jgi:cytochrome P450